MKLTPEQRKAIKQQIAELKARMDALRPTVNLENIPEWAALYEERDGLDRQLGDDEEDDST